MKKLNQAEIKEIQLKMLSYIDEICQKNNIKYTLIGGSLIGAIRHKGMIPWDDDIDIGLIYEEYMKLIKILKEKSEDSPYILLDHERNENYYFPLAKLVDKSTKLIEKDFEPIDEYGIYVDIFCFRTVPSGKKAKKYFKKQNKYNFMLGGIKKVKKEKNWFKYIVKKLRYYYVHIIGRNYYFDKLDRLHRKYENIKSDNLLSEWNVYSFDNEIKNINMFKEYIRVPFENLEVSIIKNFDEFLKTSFGDYMKLPPEDKRVTHDLTVFKR